VIAAGADVNSVDDMGNGAVSCRNVGRPIQRFTLHFSTKPGESLAELAFPLSAKNPLVNCGEIMAIDFARDATAVEIGACPGNCAATPKRVYDQISRFGKTLEQFLVKFNFLAVRMESGVSAVCFNDVLAARA
jgi:hypothetical protein